MGKKRMTIPEVADELGVTRQHIYNLIHSGCLEAMVISASGDNGPRTIRITVASVREFIRVRTYATQASQSNISVNIES